MHSVLPVSLANESGGHALHSSPALVAWYLRLHAQSSARTLARADCEALRHCVHGALPFAVLNVPAAHGEHGPPSAPV